MKRKATLTTTPRPATRYYFASVSSHPLERAPVKLPGGVVAQDYNWGVTFRGTRAQLERAFLLPKDAVFKGSKGERCTKEHWLPLNWHDGYNDACFESRCPIPQRWDASARQDDEEFHVCVQFDVLIDWNVQERANAALEALQNGQANALELIRQIPPVPLSVAVPALIKEMNARYGKPKAGKRK